MSALFALAGWAGVQIAAGSHQLTIGLGLFIGGWALRFLGHLYEGNKPAFLDDLRGLLAENAAFSARDHPRKQ